MSFLIRRFSRRPRRISIPHVPAVAAMLIGLVSVALAPSQVQAQAAPEAIRVAIPEGGPAFVYHTMRLPLGYGVEVYRQVGAEPELLLNETPVRAVGSPHEFVAEVGPVFDYVRLAFEKDDPQEIFLMLRADRIAAGILSFMYPEVALALGRLYVDTTAPLGSRVTYRLVVVDHAGVPTGQELRETLTLTPTRPAAPRDFEADNVGPDVLLTWTYPTVDVHNDDRVMRFNVYRERDGSAVRQNDTPIVRYNNIAEYDLDLENMESGDTLRLFVVAYDITGQAGEPSEVLEYVVVDNIPPAAVVDVETSITDDGFVEISWPAVSDADLAGYAVHRSTSLTIPFERLNEDLIPARTQHFVDRTVASRRAYFYSVTAIDHAGNESPLSTAAVAHVEDHEPPATPVDLRAEYLEDRTVRLAWAMPEEVPDLKTFIVLRRNITPGMHASNAQVNVDDWIRTEIMDRGEADVGFAEGAFYRFTVLAADSARNFSDSVHVVLQIPDLTPPDPPGMLRATNEAGRSVSLLWQASESNDVGAYRVYRSGDADTDAMIAQTSVSVRYLRDEEVVLGRTYIYSVAAVDTSGNESRRSLPDTVMVRSGNPPAMVRNVTARARDGGVEIRWEPVTSPGLAGYRVYVSDSPTGQFHHLVNRSADEPTYREAGSDDRWYRVSAVDISENEGRLSEPVRVSAGSLGGARRE
jgi:fibronectin type 3 domain-containing protein